MEVTSELPAASIEVRALDLGSLASVRAFADEAQEAHPVIDLLFANAGVMATPEGTTVDGFETQFGTNHEGAAGLVAEVLGDVGSVGGSVRGGGGARSASCRHRPCGCGRHALPPAMDHGWAAGRGWDRPKASEARGPGEAVVSLREGRRRAVRCRWHRGSRHLNAALVCGNGNAYETLSTTRTVAGVSYRASCPCAPRSADRGQTFVATRFERPPRALERCARPFAHPAVGATDFRRVARRREVVEDGLDVLVDRREVRAVVDQVEHAVR